MHFMASCSIVLYSKTKTTHNAIVSFVVISVYHIGLGAPYWPYRYILKLPYQPPIRYWYSYYMYQICRCAYGIQ